MQGWRLMLLRVIVVCSLLVLLVRLGELQFTQGEQFVQDAAENRLQIVLQPAPRGAILDRYGVRLARNDPAYNVVITPANLPDDPDEILNVYNRLSAMLDIPATRLVADAAGRTSERSLEEMVNEGRGIAPYRPVVIATDVPYTVMGQILEQAQLLPGVDIQVAAVREYPTGMTTAQIVGYRGPIGPEEERRLRALGYDPAFDRVGLSGIEYFFEEELAGQRGTQTWVVDVAGQSQRLVSEDPFRAGMTVQLTLDLDLQIAAQEALMRAISALNGNESKEITHQGVVIAMDPNNGQILAMVSLPSYDNTRFARTIDVPYYENQSSNALLPLANHAISSLYPPGSVWKLITSVGVIEEDVIDVNTPLYCAGRLSLPNTYAPNDQSQDQDFVCWEPNGHQDETLLEAIRDSCDIYFYQVGGGNPHLSAGIVREGGLGIYDLYRWATSFGIGSELGIELPGELAGRMPENQWKRRVWGQSWSTGDTYNAAFGQGYVTVTPLQLISAVATIANGGTLYQPTVLQNLQDANGNILQEFGPSIDRTVVLPEDGDAVLLLQEDMLRRGPESLACLCEKDSLYYNPDLCHPETYTSEFDPNPEDGIEEVVRYRVNVPYGYTFNGGLCVEDEWASLQRQLGYYLPPFADVDTLAYVRRGMRLAVTDGTASPGALEFVNVAGKTGTAEYCDDVAMAQDLCKSSKWPSHAWYVGYAPYEAPEIIVIAFVYDGGEGSVVAAPIARDVLDAYFQIKAARERQAVPE